MQLQIALTGTGMAKLYVLDVLKRNCMLRPAPVHCLRITLEQHSVLIPDVHIACTLEVAFAIPVVLMML